MFALQGMERFAFFHVRLSCASPCLWWLCQGIALPLGDSASLETLMGELYKRGVTMFSESRALIAGLELGCQQPNPPQTCIAGFVPLVCCPFVSRLPDHHYFQLLCTFEYSLNRFHPVGCYNT
eukprot:470273-Amphidinium_carterae.1